MANPFDVPLVEPQSLIVGRFTQWGRVLDLDASLYICRYKLRKGATEYTISGTDAGKYWLFTAPSATTLTWVPGEYSLDREVGRIADSEWAHVESFSLTVFATSQDRRSHAEVMVAKINSILEDRADDDVSNYSIKQRSITKMTIDELLRWRDYYLAELGREKQGHRKNSVKVRFI